MMSYKNEKKDIQFNKSEKDKQVFKESSDYNLDNKDEKIKKDLVEILDISIEIIEID